MFIFCKISYDKLRVHLHVNLKRSVFPTVFLNSDIPCNQLKNPAKKGDFCKTNLTDNASQIGPAHTHTPNTEHRQFNVSSSHNGVSFLAPSRRFSILRQSSAPKGPKTYTFISLRLNGWMSLQFSSAIFFFSLLYTSIHRFCLRKKK